MVSKNILRREMSQLAFKIYFMKSFGHKTLLWGKIKYEAEENNEFEIKYEQKTIN